MKKKMMMLKMKKKMMMLKMKIIGKMKKKMMMLKMKIIHTIVITSFIVLCIHTIVITSFIVLCIHTIVITSFIVNEPLAIDNKSKKQSATSNLRLDRTPDTPNSIKVKAQINYDRKSKNSTEEKRGMKRRCRSKLRNDDSSDDDEGIDHQ
jgi:hypothetical protein